MGARPLPGYQYNGHQHGNRAFSEEGKEYLLRNADSGYMLGVDDQTDANSYLLAGRNHVL